MKKILAGFALCLFVAGALAANPLGIGWGSPIQIGGQGNGTSGATVTTTMGTQNAGVAMCGYVDSGSAATTVITNVGFYVASVTGTPAGSSYRVSLQATTSGLPNGTVLGGGSPASASITPSATGYLDTALANSYTATRGDFLCAVVERTAATDALNKIEAWGRFTTYGSKKDVSYYSGNLGAGWANATGTPLVTFRNTDSSIIQGYPVNADLTSATTFGNTSEAGMTFNIPAQFCSTYTVKGVHFVAKGASGGNTYTASLYSAPAGTVAKLQRTTTLAAENTEQTSNDGYEIKAVFPEASLSTLTCGTTYAIGISTTTASNMKLYQIIVASASDFNAYPYAQQTALATRTITYPPTTESTSFTITATTRPVMELLLGDITPPVSSTSVGGVF